MLIAGKVGATISLASLLEANDNRLDRTCFGESASRVIVAVPRASAEELLKRASDSDLDAVRLGTVGGADLVLEGSASVAVDELRRSWESGLTIGR